GSKGSVFRVDLSLPVPSPTTFYSFTGGTDGWTPQAGMMVSTDGLLYGTTSKGGDPLWLSGTIYQVTPGTSPTLTTIHGFVGNTDGSLPKAELEEASDGNIFGAASGGGSTSGGTVFRFSRTSAPGVKLSPTSVTFGGQLIGTTSPAKAVTLTNIGTGDLKISAIGASAGFGETDDCPRSPTILGVGSSCTISVTFSPTVVGPYAGTVTITDDASDSPQTVSLAGAAVAPSVCFNATSLSFSLQPVT